jgi:hypothetical protein
MTIGESYRSIAASDDKPINVYQWKGPAPGRGIVQIAHGMGEHPLRYRSRDEAMVIASRNTWKLEPHDRSAPFEGFHRSTLSDLLKKKPDLQS